MNQHFRQKLLDLKKRDQETRTRLVETGVLFDGYHEEMAKVHEENAGQLAMIIEEVGWPGHSVVGEEGAKAAWLIAQHAIGIPEFQRYCLELIRQAVQQGEMPPQLEAYLTDRILFNERKPQMYGTIYDWDEHGEMSPWPIQDPDTIDTRRARVGLPPLAQDIQRMKEQAHQEGNTPPPDHEARQQEIEAWAIKVGWLQKVDA